MNRYIASSFMMWILAVVLAGSPPTAHAARSYDNCTGFITSVPVVITTPGIWCFNQNLSTAANANYGVDSYAIKVGSNVIVDCNGFTLDGSAGGSTTRMSGIRSDNSQNVRVRHCDVRGFQLGVYFCCQGKNLVVEDSRFDTNTATGIDVTGDRTMVRRNRILNTGGTATDAIGIHTVFEAEVLDNTIAGVAVASASNRIAYGIRMTDTHGNVAAGNRIRGVVPDGSSGTYGIQVINGNHDIIRNNNLVGSGSHSAGISCDSDFIHDIAKGNVISGYSNAFACQDGGGNVIVP